MSTEVLTIFHWEPILATWKEGRTFKTLKTPFEAGYVQARNKWNRPKYYFNLNFAPYPVTSWEEVEEIGDFFDAVKGGCDRFYIPSWHYEARCSIATNPGVNTIGVNNITRFTTTPGMAGNLVIIINWESGSKTRADNYEVRQLTGISSGYISFTATDTITNTLTIYSNVMRAYKVRFANSNMNKNNIMDHLFTVGLQFEEA